MGTPSILRPLIYAGVAIVVVTLLAVLNPPETLAYVMMGVGITLCVPVIDATVQSRGKFPIMWYTVRHWRKSIRVSASYLYRIEVGNTFLLIKGRRFQQYQPVGGVWKTTPDGNAFLQKIGAKKDDLHPVDTDSEGDLRIRVPGRQLYDFMRWFENGMGRETSTWREFYEELVAPGVVSRDNFPHVMAQWRRRRWHPLRWSHYANSYELRIADIYELLPTQAQREELQQLGDSSGRVAWASEGQINVLGAVGGEEPQLRIAESARWTI